jgi:hypothetical protein
MDDTDFAEHQRHLEFFSGPPPFTPGTVIEDIDMSPVPLDPQTEQASTSLTKPATASRSGFPTTIPADRMALRKLLAQSCTSSPQVGSTKDVTRHALLDLPPEILNMILTLVLVDKATSIPIPTFANNNDFVTPKLNVSLSILRTCKQLHAMGTPVFFRRNIFNLDPPSYHAPFGSNTRGLSPMNSKYLAMITHLEVNVEELDTNCSPPNKFDESLKLNETVKWHPCRYMGWGLGHVQWIQCVLNYDGTFRQYAGRLSIEQKRNDAIEEDSRYLNGNWYNSSAEEVMTVEEAKRWVSDDYFERHALCMVRGLPEKCKKAFSRIFVARQVGSDQVTTQSIVLIKADGDDDARHAAVGMSRSRGICVYGELQVDLVANRVKLVTGKRVGEYLW